MNRSAANASAWREEWGAIGALCVLDWHGEKVLVAGAAGGVFASSNAGDSWQPFAGRDDPRSVTTLASSRNALYAGGLQGVARISADGDTWTPLLGSQVHAVLALPGSEDNLLIAGTELDGTVRSEDGGRSWASATAGMLDAIVLALAASPPNARDRVLLAGTETGIYLSRNDAKAWRFASLPFDDVAVQCIVTAPDWSTQRVAFAGTEAAGLLRSLDGGMTWTSVPHVESRGITAIACSGTTIAVASGHDIAISEDRGETWRDLATANEDVWSLAFIETEDQQQDVIAGLARTGIQRATLRL